MTTQSNPFAPLADAKTNNVQVTFMVPAQIRDAFKAKCEKSGVPVAVVLRRLMEANS